MMNKPLLILITLLFVGALLAVGCIDVRGSGTVIAEDRVIRDFTGIDVGDTFEVEIVQSPFFSVTIGADDNLLDRVDVSKSGETLRIDLQSGSYTDVTLEARIAMPVLHRLNLSGVSKVTVAGFISSVDLVVDLSGASTLNGFIDAGDVELEVSGASKVTLEGSAKDMTIRGSGASNIELADFLISNADINLSGASRAALNVNGVISPVDLSGASRLTYQGDATLDNIRTSGASTIKRD